MATNTESPGYLNGQSGFMLAVFIVVSFFVIRPIRIPLHPSLQRVLLSYLKTIRIIGKEDHGRLSKARLRFPVSLETAPVIGVAALLATTTIHGSTIKLGVKGDQNIKPYEVLVLFISLAYISIALDGTGALEAVAFWVSKRGGSSGRRLFGYLYAFFLLTGCIVGNDPLILSGTPFLVYLTRHMSLEPTAWVFSEFMAANTASSVLVSSNPTNILIAGSFSLNYLTDFTKWTILPSIVPALLNCPVLFFMFYKSIPESLVPLQEDPWTKLRDAKAAIFFSSLMLVTLAVLVGTTFVPSGAVEVWMVTAPAGISAFVFDLASDWWKSRRKRTVTQTEEADPAAELQAVEESSGPSNQQSGPLEAVNKPTGVFGQPISAPRPPLKGYHKQRRPTTLASLLYYLTHRFPSTTRTLLRLPLPLLPFAMCEFIMVRGLAQRGWITVIARGFADACTTPAKAVFFMGFICAAFLCPLAGTNIGATIILVEIIRDPSFSRSSAVLANQRILLGAIYAVALGSNLGAFSYTFAGSLAGLLWRALLNDKGVHVSQLKFGLVNAIPLVMQTSVGCAIILGQLYWFK